jgi:hypothetical protein
MRGGVCFATELTLFHNTPPELKLLIKARAGPIESNGTLASGWSSRQLAGKALSGFGGARRMTLDLPQACYFIVVEVIAGNRRARSDWVIYLHRSGNC